MNKLSILVFPDLINNLKVFRFQFFEWSRHVSNALVQRKAAVKIVTVRLEERSACAAYCHRLCFFWACCVVLRVSARKSAIEATLTLVGFGHFQGKRESHEKCKLGKSKLKTRMYEKWRHNQWTKNRCGHVFTFVALVLAGLVTFERSR